MHILCHVIFNPMKCEYCLCGIWITANGIWIQPMKWAIYIYSFFITSNITSLDIPRAHEVLQESPNHFLLFPLPFLRRKMSGPQTMSVSVCVCRLLQLLKDKWSDSKSFYRRVQWLQPLEPPPHLSHSYTTDFFFCEFEKLMLFSILVLLTWNAIAAFSEE